MSQVFVMPSLTSPTVRSFYIYFLAAIASTTLLVAAISPTKSIIDWIDVIGEAIAFAGSAYWVSLTVSWRPHGRVTHWLGVGTGCLAFGFYLDMLDEFFSFTALPGGSFENIAVPIGVVMLTRALYLLREEQTVIAHRNVRRELEVRDHTLIDQTTTLYGTGYLINEMKQRGKTDYAIAMLEIKLEHSTSESYSVLDTVRKRSAGYIINATPNHSLVAHYAKNRFCILFPEGKELNAEFMDDFARSASSSLEKVLQLSEQMSVKVSCLLRYDYRRQDLSPRQQLLKLSQQLSILQ